MKKRKGFTLVELLAVIVVLAIISFIGFTVVADVIEVVESKKEVQNTKTLSRLVSDYLVLEQINGNSNINDKFYVIKNDVEYTVLSNGDRVESNNFKYKNKLCDYCIIKIKDKNNYSIVLEGKNQDVKAGSHINDVEVIPLEYSRSTVSSSNELLLFKDIYISNNVIDTNKILEIHDNKIIEVDTNGVQSEIYTLNNFNGTGTITVTDSADVIINAETKDRDIIKIDSDEGTTIVDNINKKDYSDDILDLYSSLKIMAQRYIINNQIDKDVYFEFKDGEISIIDPYGNKVSNKYVYIDANLKGSGELKINTSKQIQVIIYQDGYDIKTNYGNDDLYNQPLEYERDNIILFRNLHRLELLAEKYLNGSTSSSYKPSKSDWLVFYYIRQFSYTSSSWNTVSSSDSAFVTYVSNNSTYLKDYFKNQKSYTINGDSIDLRHLAAVMATLMYQTTTSDTYNTFLSQYEVDSVASWGGDLQTFMTSNVLTDLGSSATSTSYKNYTLNNLGNSNTVFSLDDMYADTDAWCIYTNIKNNTMNIYDAFHKFYTGIGSYNYKKRFTSFKAILESTSGKTFSNLVYKFTKKVYIDVILTTVNWPLLDAYNISSNMSTGVRDGFVNWVQNKISLE